MRTGNSEVGMAVENAVANFGNALLADSAELRHKLRGKEISEQEFYRGLLHLAFGLFFESLDCAPLGDSANGMLFQQATESISSQFDASMLGAAYESLLELKLGIDTDSQTVTLGRAEQHDRKVRGSYYTPPELVEKILDWTLDPAIDEALSSNEPEPALLSLKILDPACGSGHFLTAAANRVGCALACLRSARHNPPDEEIEQSRREVVEQCIFGVDIDPIAVELCKFALSPGPDGSPSKKQTGLDGRICCGDSLLGLTPKLLADTDPKVPDTSHGKPFHWHLEFPDVFKGAQANSATGWSGGFDVIVGNPPFLNQLETSTAQSRKLAAFLKHRYPGVAKGYADTAAVFAELSSQLVRPDGGRIGLVQPASILASADTKGARRALAERGTLETLWVAGQGVFDASVRTCVVVFRNGTTRSSTPAAVDGVEQPQRSVGGTPSSTTGELRRFTGLDFRALPPTPIDPGEIAGMETWAPLIADGFGIPNVVVDESHTLGESLNATADFRDQYYGLVPFVAEADGRAPSGRAPSGRVSDGRAQGGRAPDGRAPDGRVPGGRVPDGADLAALITAGLIDPAELLWGKQPTRFNKTTYKAPVVDLKRLRSESDLGDWATNRLVPKLLVATQTRVIEVVVDEAGVLLPSVPVITVTVEDISLWHAAAALMSPPITAWSAARYMGAALNIDSLKLSATQVQNLPKPKASAAWDRAAQLIRGASSPTQPQERRRQLTEAGALMCNAYGIVDSDQLMEWWRARLGKERTL